MDLSIQPNDNVNHAFDCDKPSAGKQRELFNAFYQKHCDRVFGFCRNRGISTEESREFTQDIFMSVYINRVYNFPENQALPWLFTTARNKVISYMRSTMIRHGHANSVQRAGQEWHVSYPSPDEFVQESDRISRLRLVIENAPPMVRKCLILKYFQQLSYDEMADFLGLSLNTIKTHIKRGLQLLRIQFRDQTDE